LDGLLQLDRIRQTGKAAPQQPYNGDYTGTYGDALDFLITPLWCYRFGNTPPFFNNTILRKRGKLRATPQMF
jgi:hypothetical protein